MIYIKLDIYQIKKKKRKLLIKNFLTPQKKKIQNKK